MTSTGTPDTQGPITTATSTDKAVRPFTIAVDQADLDDLADRLARTRLPRPAPGDDWDLRHAEPVPGRDGGAVAHVRLAGARGADERHAELPDRDRRPDDPLRARALEGGGSDAAVVAAHLPGLVRGVPRHDRPADRP